MLIETYKGIQIKHDAKADEFYTDIVINTTPSGKKEYIRGGRLQKVRDYVDKFLNTSGKKVVIPQAWLKDGETYQLVDVILFNAISKRFVIQKKGHRQEEFGASRYGRSAQLFIKSKENDAIIKELIAKQVEIAKIEKTVSCSSGKLIPLSEEHTEEED